MVENTVFYHISEIQFNPLILERVTNFQKLTKRHDGAFTKQLHFFKEKQENC